MTRIPVSFRGFGHTLPRIDNPRLGSSILSLGTSKPCFCGVFVPGARAESCRSRHLGDPSAFAGDIEIAADVEPAWEGWAGPRGVVSEQRALDECILRGGSVMSPAAVTFCQFAGGHAVLHSRPPRSESRAYLQRMRRPRAPSSASRRGNSSAMKNSSSWGGFTLVPASIA
jgi:hypothetical protein